MSDVEALFDAIRARLAELPESSDSHRDLLAHLRNLARFGAEPMDYPDVQEVAFPRALHVAYAVCHPACGVREFIVDGSTQECQYCGGLLFRTETREYVLRQAES